MATEAPARQPLEATRDFAEVVAAYPEADLRFALAVSRIYGRIARAPELAETMRLIQRLGLDKVSAVRGALRILARDRLGLTAEVGSRAPHRGVLDAMGPPVELTRPVRVPADATFALSASVSPGRLFDAASLVASGVSPVDATLALTHLRGVEQQLGHRFAEDALGKAPRVWTLWSRRTAGGVDEHALVLEVGDVAVTRRFIEAYLGVAEGLLRGTKVTRSGSAVEPRWLVRLPNRAEVALGFTAEALVVASRLEAVATSAATTARARPVLGGAGSATLFGGGKGVAGAILTQVLAELGQPAVPVKDVTELTALLGNDGITIAAELRAR